MDNEDYKLNEDMMPLSELVKKRYYAETLINWIIEFRFRFSTHSCDNQSRFLSGKKHV